MTELEKVPEEHKVQLAKLDHFTNVGEMREFAEVLIRSKVIPATFQSAEAVMATIAQGRELGLPAVTSLYNMYFISGKPTLSIHALLGLLRSKGLAWKTIYDFEPILNEKGERVDAKTTIRFYRKEPQLGIVIEEDFTYTWKEASEAGLTSKETWKKYKKTLLWNRCAAFGARRIAPDILTGVYETTEMLDTQPRSSYKLDDEGNVTTIDITQ